MKKHLFLLLALLCAGATHWSPMLWGQEPGGPVVVLKNGAVLRGKGTNLGEKVSVELADGGVVKLAKSQVELIADSIDDAYLQRRDRLIPENILSQLNLAGWCIEQNMLPEAQSHLRDARKIDPSHPGILRLERKIREHQRREEEELPAPSTAAPPVQEMREQLKERLEAARRDTRTQTAELSPAVRLKFNREVQPILLASCAASKCHGPTSSGDLRLVRSSSQNENHAVLVRRNLQTVLSRLRVDAPELSPLLEKAVQPHAPGMSEPPLDIDSADFSLLISWVIEATEDIQAAPSSTAAPASPPTISTSPRSIRSGSNGPSSMGPGSIRPGSMGPGGAGSAGAGEEPSPEEESPRGASRLAQRPSRGGKPRSGEEKSAPRGAAPSDPEEFNRRYFPDPPK